MCEEKQDQQTSPVCYLSFPELLDTTASFTKLQPFSGTSQLTLL